MKALVVYSSRIGENSVNGQTQEIKKGHVCKVCGYVHEGDLPDDFICPLCKHGVADFEEIK